MKITANMAITLDGYIARKDGSVDYLDKYNQHVFETDYFPNFLKDKDLVIMGHSAYELMLSWGFPWENKRVVVFTTSKDLKKVDENVEFFEGTVSEFMTQFKFENAFLFGGANITKQFIDSNLVDCFEWAEIPEEISKGIKLFNRDELVSKYNFKLNWEKPLSTIMLYNYIKK